jgi:hypothetical protein
MRLIVQEKSGDWDGTFKKLNKDVRARMKDWKRQ